MDKRFNQAINPNNANKIYKIALTQKTFIFFTALRMVIAAGTFSYIVELPFLLHNLNYSTTTIGMVFFIINTGFFLGATLSSKLLKYAHHHIQQS